MKCQNVVRRCLSPSAIVKIKGALKRFIQTFVKFETDELMMLIMIIIMLIMIWCSFIYYHLWSLKLLNWCWWCWVDVALAKERLMWGLSWKPSVGLHLHIWYILFYKQSFVFVFVFVFVCTWSIFLYKQSCCSSNSTTAEEPLVWNAYWTKICILFFHLLSIKFLTETNKLRKGWM